MRRGQSRHVFAGTNTAYGFHSFFGEIVHPGARRIFIFKGGPGSGKSTVMRHIAQALLDDGYDIDFFHCSADSNSIDGFEAPGIGIVMLDGTTPHVIDPQWPNAIDEIIDLGQFCDSRGIQQHRDRIVEKSRQGKFYYQHAYHYLAAAKTYLTGIEEQVSQSGARNEAALNLITADLISDIFGDAGMLPRKPMVRRLFASAITPDGFRNHLNSIFDPLKKRYILKGHWGTGKGTIIAKVRDAALARGYDLELYFCALDPYKLEHMVIKQLGIGIVTSSLPHLYVPRNDDIVIDTAQAINADALAAVGEDISISRNMYGRSLELALGWLSRAQKQHLEVEELYAPYMDFAAINGLADQLLERIRDDYCEPATS